MSKKNVFYFCGIGIEQTWNQLNMSMWTWWRWPDGMRLFHIAEHRPSA